MDALQAKLPLLLRQFPRIGQETIEGAAAADPTRQKKYLTWILRMLARETIRLPEDAEKLCGRLASFDRLKKLPAFGGARDINTYRTYGDLAKAIEEASGVRSAKEEAAHREIEGCALTIEHPPYKVFTLSTPEAAMAASRGTEWCTKGRAWCEEYLEKGNLYLVFKDDKKFAQVHAPSAQWLDVWDNELDAESFSELRTVMIPVLGDEHRTDPQAAFNHLMKLKELFENEPNEEGNDLSDVFDLAPYESLIATDAHAATCFAEDFLEERFPAGEPAIMQDAMRAAYYARRVLRKRWPKAEPIIARHGMAATDYASCVLCGPWDKAEKYAFAPAEKRPKEWHDAAIKYYVEVVHRGHLLDRQQILRTPKSAAKHAQDLANAAKTAVVTSVSGFGQREVRAAAYLLKWNAAHGPSQAELEAKMAEGPCGKQETAMEAYALTADAPSPEAVLSF